MKHLRSVLAILSLLLTATVIAPATADAGGGDDPIEIVVRAFMPAEAYWFPGMYPELGDNRSFANEEPASSRLSIRLLISPVDGSLVAPPTVTAAPLVQLYADQTQHAPEKPFWWQELLYEDPVRWIQTNNWKQYVSVYDAANVWVDIDDMPIDREQWMVGLDGRFYFEVGPNADGVHSLSVNGRFLGFPSWEVWVDGEPIVLFDAETAEGIGSIYVRYQDFEREIPLPQPPVTDPVDDGNDGGSGTQNGGGGFKPDPGPGDDIDGHTFDDIGGSHDGTHASSGDGSAGDADSGMIRVICEGEEPIYLEATVENILAFIDDCIIEYV